MSVASVFASLNALSLPRAAARLAAAGVPVFPCVPRAKNPLLTPDEENPKSRPGGFRMATTDARQVAAWWRRWPAANIGVPTGTASGVDVVEVDRKPGGDGFAAFERAPSCRAGAGLAGGGAFRLGRGALPLPGRPEPTAAILGVSERARGLPWRRRLHHRPAFDHRRRRASRAL